MEDRRRSVVALGVAAAAAVAMTAALLWPFPLALGHARPLSAFNDGHIWAFRHVARLLVGLDPWTMGVPDVGWPANPEARYIAWLPAVLVAPLQPIVGPFAAYDLALLFMPALNVAGAWLLLRRVAPQSPWVVAAAALAWALCPYALGSLANGQICKLQMWVLPVWAAALTVAVEGERPRRGLLWVGLAALVGSFSEPSYALHLPFLGAAWGVGLLVRAPQRWRVTLARGVAAMLVTAICLLPARAYYAPPEDTTVLVHQPATPDTARPRGAVPQGVATLRETLLGDTARDTAPDSTNHPTYLVLPLLIAALAFSATRPGWRVAGIATLVVGASLAAGEHLVGDRAFVTLGGMMLAMPNRVIAALGYPLAASGMYYRLIAIAQLGVVVLFAAGLAGRRHRDVIAAAVCAISLADSVRSTRALWPRPIARVAGAKVFEEIAADTAPGAVFDLPVYYRAQVGSEMVLATLLHARATTALPRNVYKDSVPASEELHDTIETWIAGDPASGRAALRARGFRWVVLHTLPPPPELDLAGLQRLLGPPRVDGPVLAWRLEDPPPAE